MFDVITYQLADEKKTFFVGQEVEVFVSGKWKPARVIKLSEMAVTVRYRGEKPPRLVTRRVDMWAFKRRHELTFDRIRAKEQKEQNDPIRGFKDSP